MTRKQLRKTQYEHIMDGISYYEMKYDSAMPELYAAARKSTNNIIEKIKLFIKEKRA